MKMFMRIYICMCFCIFLLFIKQTLLFIFLTGGGSCRHLRGLGDNVG